MTELSTAKSEHTKGLADKVYFGFWVYLMTDLIVFAVLFATFAVLRNSTFNGPSGADIFDMPIVLTETMLLLTSSFLCGLGMLALHKKDKIQSLVWFVATFLLGLGFLAMELYEFNHLISEGHTWQSSAFLSSYFTLVGTHGLHIAVGLLWFGIMIGYILKKGLNDSAVRKMTWLSLFWHFLDVVWIFIFTVVYLMGVI
jgi:cytochrome o ubiquinol oxidase subunit 3